MEKKCLTCPRDRKEGPGGLETSKLREGEGKMRVEFMKVRLDFCVNFVFVFFFFLRETETETV